MARESHAAEQAILALLRARAPGRTICPSEAARALAGSDERADWEPHMEPVRAAAAYLVAARKIDVTQHGRVIDLDHAKGPIRLRLR